MSNKKNLILALEAADDNGREVELSFSSHDGISMSVLLKPEVMVRGNEIEIYAKNDDANDENVCRVSVVVGDDVDYYDDGDEEEYVVNNGDSTFRFFFK